MCVPILQVNVYIHSLLASLLIMKGLMCIHTFQILLRTVQPRVYNRTEQQSKTFFSQNIFKKVEIWYQPSLIQTLSGILIMGCICS